MEHASLFAEDREFNQGEFAEAVRDQALGERLEFFGEVEVALAAQAGGGADVSRAYVAAALQACDVGLSGKQARGWGVWGWVAGVGEGSGRGARRRGRS